VSVCVCVCVCVCAGDRKGERRAEVLSVHYQLGTVNPPVR